MELNDQLHVLECISSVYYEEKEASLMMRFTLYAMFWMVLIALSSNLYSHTCLCVCNLRVSFFSFLFFYWITLSEPTLQTNTICSNIYTFGCSLNVRQNEKTRSRSLVDNLLVCWIVLCCFIHIFFSFTVPDCSVFLQHFLRSVGPETVMEICIIYGLNSKPNEAYWHYVSKIACSTIIKP